MTNTYITKKFIGDSNQSELDFELQRGFGFDYDDGGNFIEIEKGTGSASSEPIEIDKLVEILNHLKSKGATHVQIEDHCDHQGYDISGFEIRVSYPEEIEAYEKHEREKNDKRKKILELQQQISKIQHS
jgi:hypothetical protein